MYAVICTDNKILDMSNFSGYKWSNVVFGPFTEKYDAEEWVDNYCGKKILEYSEIKCHNH